MAKETKVTSSRQARGSDPSRRANHPVTPPMIQASDAAATGSAESELDTSVAVIVEPGPEAVSESESAKSAEQVVRISDVETPAVAGQPEAEAPRAPMGAPKAVTERKKAARRPLAQPTKLRSPRQIRSSGPAIAREPQRDPAQPSAAQLGPARTAADTKPSQASLAVSTPSALDLGLKCQVLMLDLVTAQIDASIAAYEALARTRSPAAAIETQVTFLQRTAQRTVGHGLAMFRLATDIAAWKPAPSSR